MCLSVPGKVLEITEEDGFKMGNIDTTNNCLSRRGHRIPEFITTSISMFNRVYKVTSFSINSNLTEGWNI